MRKVLSPILSLPTPSNISYAWRGGSLLGLALGIQIITGVIMTISYCSDVTLAFSSVIHIMRDSGIGWLIRLIHCNGARFYILFIYLHIARGLYYKRPSRKPITWSVGVTMYLISIGVAFLGYVLPWGQIRFWGATVITNLIRAFPGGDDLVVWVWGGFSVGGPTLTRFYTLHFLLPFGVLVLIVVHLASLHATGRSNPLGSRFHIGKAHFHPYFTYKDIYGFIVYFWLFSFVVFYASYSLLDAENFIEANRIVTPTHIQPEWYFLFAYAILRRIPRKLGGVIALLLSVLVLYVLPFKRSKNSPKPLFWRFCVVFLLLTWLGSCHIEEPYTRLSILLRVLYFVLIIIICFIGEIITLPFHGKIFLNKKIK